MLESFTKAHFDTPFSQEQYQAVAGAIAEAASLSINGNSHAHPLVILSDILGDKFETGDKLGSYPEFVSLCKFPSDFPGWKSSRSVD